MKSTKTHQPAQQKNIVFPIIGIGASAGGLEAFTQFLKGLPSNPGIALVLIQHLDPTHESMTAEILSRSTQMPVTEVTNGTRVESNHVYVIPPNHAMSISGGVLSLEPRIESRGPYMTIDYFFQSLAEDQKNQAIGVVLSGTAFDGTEGLRTIKAAGGLTFAQEPQSAKFDSMPRSAIASGNVDFILKAEDIGSELARVIKHPYLKLPTEHSNEDESEADSTTKDQLQPLLRLLKEKTRVDFSGYKHSTLQRRISRRMVVQKKATIEDYTTYIRDNPEEAETLRADILIHVTRFFRDFQAFQSLAELALPKLMTDRPSDTPVRVWVPGCSTGEEVYSLAITLTEFLGEATPHIPFQIFATDISDQALQKARAGVYPETISRDVSPARLKRFFTKVDEGYKISKNLRDLCLFSKHDVTADVPFAKLDIISCRNLLIYFSSTLQKRVIPIFHYSLKPNGFLLLGRSESVSGFSDLFASFDKPGRIYTRKPGRPGSRFHYPSDTSSQKNETQHSQPILRHAPPVFDLQKETESAILLESSPPGVIVNDRMEILQFRGRISPYLAPASGQASHQLFKMARPSLASDLRMLIQTAKKTNTTEKRKGLQLMEEGRPRKFDIKVIPIVNPSHPDDRFFLILFERGRTLKKRVVDRTKTGTKRKNVLRKINLELGRELAENKKYQEALAHDYETAHEELAVTTEEFQSTNEEMQSTNEELETAKEELQSTNEELITVNEELQSRNTELSHLNSDLMNFLSSVEIPILMLENDGRIRRFTPSAEKILRLLPTDVGRSIGDFKSNFRSVGIELNLNQMVTEVVTSGKSREIEVQDRENRWYRLQIKPYRTLEDKIDGAVVAFIDINILKDVLKDVKAARLEAENANRAKDLFLATLSHELRTPLTAILAWAQMLRRGKLDEAKSKRAAVMIEESGKAQAQLINDLLDVSRIVMGKVALELEEVEPVIAIRAAVESVRSTADAKSIRIETEFTADIGTVMADPVRLQQVFSNLLTNSTKFSPRGSTIHIKMERVMNAVKIQVKDAGKGITAEFLPHIFDRFAQAESSDTRILGGLGLGLAIVRNLVDLQGGKISAESGGTGKGATFTVYLPLKSEKKTKEAQQIENSHKMHQMELGKVRLDGLKILLVDDDPKAREALMEMVQSYGADTKTADTTEEAMKLFDVYKPDVVLSDIAMPGEDGYALIKKIRGLPESAGGKTPAIAVTAYPATTDIEQTLSAGFQFHVAKPVDSDLLANKIATASKIKSSFASLESVD